MNIDMPANTIYCLDDGIGGIALIDSMGGDISIVNSARVSFNKQIEQITDNDKKLIKYLLKHDHGTPFEHNALTFLVKCPMFIARQWMRHRIASYNEISRRYTDENIEFYIPKQLRKQSDNNRQASIDEYVEDNTIKVITEQCFDAYNSLLQAGVSREQARIVLPQNTYTMFYYTCNLRSLLHFIDLRSHAGAQWEIQQYANSLLQLIKPVFPEAIKIVGELDNEAVI